MYKSKYFFRLTGLDTTKIYNMYGISVPDPMSTTSSTTNVSELESKRSTIPNAISFLDESKRPHNCTVSMIDFTSSSPVSTLRYHCFWDHHPFESDPIGCPLRYIPNKIVKVYKSKISKDIYSIKQDITTRHSLDVIEDEHIQLTKGGKYETDGVFCSVNCCQAFINANKHTGKYDQSTTLLLKLCRDLGKTRSENGIIAAPSWRLLQVYGGHLTISKFREGFDSVDFETHGPVRTLFSPLGILTEAKIKF